MMRSTIDRPRRLIVTLSFLFLLVCCGTASASMYINLVAVNASSDKTRALPLKYYLPKELKPDDVLDAKGLLIDYDIDQGQYFIYGTLTMAPKESRTLRLEVRDVWRVTPKEIEVIKQEIDANLKRVADTEYYKRGVALRSEMLAKLDYIIQQQEEFSGNVERRIEEYRAHVDVLNEIRTMTFSIEYWESQQAKLPQAPSDYDGKTVKFVLEVENPNKEQVKILKQQHFLPGEVKSENIVDSQGFDVRFDETKQQAHLHKEEEFQAGEKKRYEVVIQDIWHVTEDKMNGLRERSKLALKELRGSDYISSAQYLYDGIVKNLDEVKRLQEQPANMKEHIGVYRINKKTIAATEEDVLKLERILALVRQKKLEELEKSRVKNILKKIQSLDGLAAVAQAVFKQKLSVNRTWKVIIGTLIFVAFFTAVHFFVWHKRSRDARRKTAAAKPQTA